jgi:hypothetical protein
MDEREKAIEIISANNGIISGSEIVLNQIHENALLELGLSHSWYYDGWELPLSIRCTSQLIGSTVEVRPRSSFVIRNVLLALSSSEQETAKRAE